MRETIFFQQSDFWHHIKARTWQSSTQSTVKSPGLKGLLKAAGISRQQSGPEKHKYIGGDSVSQDKAILSAVFSQTHWRAKFGKGYKH